MRSAPGGVTPTQPTQVREPFHRPGWVYEEKVDGYRMLAYSDGKHARLVSRNNVDHSKRFPELVSRAYRAGRSPSTVRWPIFDQQLRSRFEWLIILPTDRDGSVLGAVAIVRDVTARWEQEQALRSASAWPRWKPRRAAPVDAGPFRRDSLIDSPPSSTAVNAAFKVDTLARLLDATRRLASVQDETPVIQTIIDSAMTVFEMPGAALFIGGADTGVLAGVSGCCAAIPAGMRLSPSQAARLNQGGGGHHHRGHEQRRCARTCPRPPSWCTAMRPAGAGRAQPARQFTGLLVD